MTVLTYIVNVRWCNRLSYTTNRLFSYSIVLLYPNIYHILIIFHELAEILPSNKKQNFPEEQSVQAAASSRLSSM